MSTGPPCRPLPAHRPWRPTGRGWSRTWAMRCGTWRRRNWRTRISNDAGSDAGQKQEERQFMRRVVIIGGGAIGSAIAYFLTGDPKEEPFEVTVVERDFSYKQASSALSASSIRQQFSTAINIEMSLYG